MASTVSEVLWVRWLLSELRIDTSSPTPLFCDNQAARHIANNPFFHERTKHVEMDCYFVRERVDSKEIVPMHISSKLQIADLLTKGLTAHQLQLLLGKISIINLHALEMIRANINSNEGNKGELYYQLGIGLYRIGDGKGAKKALEECLKIDGTLSEARNLLENVELILRADEPKNTISKSTLLKHVAVAGGLALGVTCGCLSKSKLLKHVAVAGGLALGVACTMIFPWEKLNEFAGDLKKAGELGESIEKMTDGNKAGLGTAGVVAGIVGVAFFIGLKKSSSG
nr:protein kinase-like domain-containing protein [Tanacetum cinerariifolium]